MSQNQNTATVGVIMGSQSDLPIMEGAIAALKKFGITADVKIVSAHRTPEIMAEYASTARNRGLKAIIAGAGGAAHLPGMVASYTTLPVIGVPVNSSNSIEGIDSLLSIVQMPKGVPVASVAIGGAFNAGLLAVQIIGASDPKVAQKLEEYKQELKDQVAQMNQNLE